VAAAHTGQRWVTAGWIAAVTATAVNGLVVGYGAVWLQLFGDAADAEDYRVSAGGYGAAALVLALGVIAILTHRGPRWLAGAAGAAAAFLGVLAASSAAASARAEPVSSPVDTAWDGVGGVVWAPWTWALFLLAVHGLLRWGATPRPSSRWSSRQRSPRSR
jgi:hypothetical protein